MRTIVVIPALNESNSIAHVVATILSLAPVIVVDDGSSDETASLARDAGADVLSHGKCFGYDQALETGLRRALDLGYEYAVTLDGDGQHRASTIQVFLEEFAKGADLVIGARNRRQRWAEQIFGVMANAFWGIRDPLCGMKGYRLELISKAGYFDSYRSIGTEFSIRAARSGCKISQVSIVIYDRPGQSRFGAGLTANCQILRAMWYGLISARPFNIS